MHIHTSGDEKADSSIGYLENFNFETLEDSAIAQTFLKNGYFKFKVRDLKALNLLKKEVAKLAAKHAPVDFDINCDDAAIDIFLNSAHSKISLTELNRIRMAIYADLNANRWFRPLYYNLGKFALDAILGNELVMQNRVNLSIQFPKDDSSLLPAHCDFFSGESPFQVVLWTPLVNVFDTKSMFILSPDENKKLIPSIAKHRSMNTIFDSIKNKVSFLNINFGEAMVFSPNLLHGNVVNQVPETRWSFNARFKSLLSPYNEIEGNEKKLGMFYLPITTKPVTKIGMVHRHPEGFDDENN